VGISGSIAAYKTITLVRLLVKEGAEVKVIMTPSAEAFVSPLVLSTLSKHEVVSAFANEGSWSNHVMLGRWADLFLLAPATCNTIAKMASGLCDNMLMAVYLSATCPVWVAPAMDEDMWYHETTARNLAWLQQHGKFVLSVSSGELASGLTGMGRMMEPEEILQRTKDHFMVKGVLLGKKVLVTAGPTFEPIDPVRFIGNHSSGLMGMEIAGAFEQLGAEVMLVLGPSHLSPPAAVTTVRVQTAAEMFTVCKQHLASMDIVVMSAAVADYRPANVAGEKIKKSEDSLHIELVRNPDILAYAGKHKSKGQFVAGFALETQNELENARTKLEKKQADLIVLNSLNDDEAGFGKSTNKVTLVQQSGHIAWPASTKRELAERLTNFIADKVNEPKELIS